MTTLSIQPPYPILTGADGQPLEDGYVWIGTANLNPITNPIAVYWDAALTQPAGQPIRTSGGYPVNAGTPARLYVGGDYSILVQDRKGSTVYSAPAATERYSDPVVTGISSAEVSFLQAGSGAVTRTVQSKLRDAVSVKDFGAAGDGVTNDTAAYLAAIATGKNVYFPQGTYLVAPVTPGAPARESAAVLSANQTIFGDGADSVIQWGTGIAATRQTLMMIKTGSNITVRNLRFTNSIIAVQITADADGGVENVTFENLTVDNIDIGLGIGEQIALDPSGSKYVKNVTIRNCHFDTVAVHGVLTSNIYGFVVDGCYFNNVGYRPTSGGFCVDMSQGSRYGVLANCIAENSRYFCKTESFQVAPATAANCLSHHIVITNNVVRDMVPQAGGTTEAAILLNHGASSISVVDNIVEYPNTGTCLRAIDGNLSASGPTLIANNQFRAAYYSLLIAMNTAGLNTQIVIEGNAINANVGCRIEHTNIEIKNNSIETTLTGIEITDDCAGISIVGNKIISTNYGILFGASLSDVFISNNKITSTTNAIYSASDPSSNVTISGNYLKGASGSYLASTSGLVVQGNSITTTGTANTPSFLISTTTNATVSENTINTNSSNPNVSLKVDGTLNNVLVENNRTSRTVSVGAGTNVVSANNAFALSYTS